MNRREYTERLLSGLRRLTPGEREAVRLELEGHMEDHLLALLDLGYPEALAEERTMAAMGDPEEVARELEKQYSPFWRAVNSVANGALVLLLVMALGGAFNTTRIYSNLQARFSPWSNISEEWEERMDLKLDIRQTIGSDVVRVLGSGIEEEDGILVAKVLYCQYDESPFGCHTDLRLQLADRRGEEAVSGGYSKDDGAMYGNNYIKVQPGDPCVYIICDYQGERISVEVPLTWEGTAYG